MKLRKALMFMGFFSVWGMFSPSLAQAKESAWAQADFVKARIITEKTAMGQEKTLRAALEIVMEPDWHIYWRTPGDGGLAPVLDWDESLNLKQADLLWPPPVRFEYEGLYGFGYKNAAMLPLVLIPGKTGQEMKLVLHADIMVCKNLCVPQTLDLSLTIPAGEAAKDAQASPIAAALETLPYTENRPDMKIESVVLGPKAIVVQAWLAKGFEGADLFAEAGPDISIVSKPQIKPDQKDPRSASLVIPAPEGMENLAAALMGKKLVLTLTKDGKALERDFTF